MRSGEGKGGNRQGNKLKAERDDRYVKKRRRKEKRKPKGKGRGEHFRVVASEWPTGGVRITRRRV
jgi:hypothetical protein